MTAKVGDFGLARLLVQSSTDQASISSTHVLRGSIGYIPPEYGWGEKPSTAGDVYSFGIVLLELFSGKSPQDDCFTGDLGIRKWVQSAFKNKAIQVIDTQLLSLIFHDDSARDSNLQLNCVDAIMGVGMSCTADNPDDRIGIRVAVRQLKAARDSLMNQSNIYIRSPTDIKRGSDFPRLLRQRSNRYTMSDKK
ncbi:putative LRR receptor serine/threonine-protein kinase [Trifolium repens]|nr:putative LRR receptor serine/threonine-protein kinase [Trifolium repens]